MTSPLPNGLNLTEHVGALVLANDATKATSEFLGTAFPISEGLRLYLTANHCLKEPSPGNHLAIHIQKLGQLLSFPVTDRELLAKQTDVCDPQS